MKADKRETNQVPSALLQKFSLKINIEDYEGAAQVLVALGLPNPKLSPTSEIRPSAEIHQDFLHFYAYILYVK